MNKDFQNQLNDLISEFDDKVDALAEEYRTRVLIPLCKKHKLCFISGMGSFYFYPARDYGSKYSSARIIGDKQDAHLAGKGFLVLCLQVLNMEISHGQYFGFRVNNIEPDDIK